jgi:SAM-dependent methyltransferase
VAFFPLQVARPRVPFCVQALRRFQGLALALNPAARRIRSMLRRFGRRLGVSDRVLDLGSGAAPYAELFPHRRYVTADLFAPAAVRCDAAALPFARETFDLVLCSEVLEHVREPEATLSEIRRILTPRGTLALTTPLTWGVHEARDFHRWTDSGLVQLLSRRGFDIVELEARGGILLCLSALLLMVPWQLLGDTTERRPWQTLLYAALYLVLLPPALLLALLDPLDRRRHFTHGYAALCRRSSEARRPDTEVAPLMAPGRGAR